MDYIVGLNISFISSLLITIILGIIYSIKRPWLKDASRNLPINDFYKYSAIGWTIALFLFFSLFNAFYSVINISLNIVEADTAIRELLLVEIKNGVIAIRLTSITLGISFVSLVFKLAKNTPFPNENKKEEYLDYKESRKFLVNCTPKMNSYEFNFLGVTQKAFYLFILSVLWLFTIKNFKSDYSFLLSYALFYIVDDWLIVFRHSIILKGHIVKWHNIRIWLMNFLIVVLGVLSFGNHYVQMFFF